MATLTTLSKQGCFDADLEKQLNDNFTNVNAALTTGTGLVLTSATGLPGSTGLVANSVSAGQVDSQLIQYVSIPLTLAQLIAANSVPIPLLAAQGAGTLIDVVSLTLDLIRGSAAFVGGGAMAAYLGTDSTGVLATATIAATVFTTFAASQMIKVAGALAVAASSTILNKGLVFTNPTADFTSGTGGSGIVKLAYRVLPGLS
jgi:hypothetical protein